MPGLSVEALQAVVQRCAKRFGDSQLAQCANQISSDLMPPNAALQEYSELFTSTQAYISGVQEEVRSFVQMMGVDRFSRGDLAALQEVVDQHFEKVTNLAAVLWQNGLLGYVDESGRRRFYSMSDVEQFHYPPDANTYVLHPCLVYAVGGIQHVREDSGGKRRRTRRFTPPERKDLPQAPAAEPRHGNGGTRALPEPAPTATRSVARAADYAVGDVIDGRFKILEKLGEGGFSKVYRVRDDVEDKERALKLFATAAGHEAVRREISALREIRHPNVVEVFWAGQTKAGDWYLIIEFIAGESLEEFVTGERNLRDREADRVLETNVEFWAAIVLDFAGVPPHMFTSMFTCARTAGWAAHILEQKRTGRLVRPAARYIGPPTRSVRDVPGADQVLDRQVLAPDGPAGRLRQ